MRTIFVAISVTAVLCISLLAQGEKQFTVQGRIADGDSKESVPGARVRLTPVEQKEPLFVSTDDQGRFSFSVPGTGKYRLHVEKTGFFNLDLAREIELKANDVSLGDIPFIGKRAIAGVVRWQNGDPASGAFVVAIQVRGTGLGSEKRQQADDRGQFRIVDLQPGRYVVFAAVQGTVRSNELERAALPVFYPGTLGFDISDALDLRHIREAQRPLEFTIQRTQGVTISGTVEPSNAVSSVDIGLIIPGVPALEFTLVRVKRGSRFSLPGIPPGSYYLTVSEPGAAATVLRDVQPVTVFNSPIENLRVSVPRRSPIEGVIKIDEPRAEDKLEGLRLLASTEKFRYKVGTLVKPVNANGEFEIGGILHGEPYRLEIQNVPERLYVASVRQSDRELAGGRLIVRASDEDGPVTVLLKSDGGAVNGAVIKGKENAVSGFVVLAPLEREALHRYRTANVSEDGSYALHGVAPGEYSLFALDRNYGDEYLDLQFVKKLTRDILNIEVAAGANLSANLNLIEVR